MKPETAEFIAYAIKLLSDADRMLDTGLDDHAARTAKTHGGVQTEFFRLSNDDDRSDPELRAFLTTAYHYNPCSDYETGPEDNPSPEEAREAVEIARRFVAQFAPLTPLP